MSLLGTPLLATNLFRHLTKEVLGTLCWLAINLVTSYTALFIIKILFNLTQTYTLTNDTKQDYLLLCTLGYNNND